ncbi:MAG: prepilin-type N-terminal cleavage/methylation domain-containing protein [Verrucomicrobiota bacterium JB024]|nr:prepilin-type N-terminal cleavage/methylation domain-containing protein [Verrucomicrobiota bacterium JB024]
MDYRIKSSASRTRQRFSRDRQVRGFTLTELLIAITILSLVMAGTLSTFYTFSKTTKMSLNHIDQSAQLQAAFESVLRNMRAISQVHQTTSSTFEFTTARMDGTTERVRLTYDANARALIRISVTNNTTRTLIDDVTAVTFTYFNRFGEETNTQIDMNAAKLEVSSERESTLGNKSVDTETALITFRNRTL